MSRSDKNLSFPVDGQLLMVLPRASASAKNPDVQLPVLRSDRDGYYLEMRVEADSNGSGEVSVTRRVSLEDLTAEEWEELKHQYDSLNFDALVAQGVGKGLEKIQDRKIQRLFVALMTFLNPRQVAIVLYLYKLAAEQDDGPVVTFRSNDLLESLGYSKTRGGSFHARVRSQLNQDLVALHRVELMMAKSLRDGNKIGAEVLIKSILRIRSYKMDNLSRDFDLGKAADYTYELADSYTISLEFFEGTGRTGDYVLFASDIDITQKHGSNAKNDYKTKLLVYLASRLKWDSPQDRQYLVVSKQYLFKNLDLLGSNKSRNNQIFWRTVEELQQEGYILGAQELTEKRKTSVQFQINPEKLTLGAR
ncbi:MULTISPECIES: hypothetical protein [unclassified Leptolyngbya]|uniref:hypothetical protein n=1 Tax=unclassified Leptolyngbya TaxID=2650499 RepID=UPI00168A35FA|nr:MULTISPECIES: hypothetical protein [unclassified Leptolyngbya]MBD1910663.1 hypothetical protein [Leptolyngbya sp. FACHB-8]MBD2158414.1 hypothetical protein [Leptolyngbya sp. FACHB-16]